MTFLADSINQRTHDRDRGWHLRSDVVGGWSSFRYFAIIGPDFECRFECRLLYRDATAEELGRGLDTLRTGVWVIDRVETCIPGMDRAATIAVIVEAMTAYGINHSPPARQNITARASITLDLGGPPLFAQWQGFLGEVIRRREADMLPAARIKAAAARCTGDEAELDEIRLDHLFDCVARL
jgi:hypothetical protein